MKTSMKMLLSLSLLIGAGCRSLEKTINDSPIWFPAENASGLLRDPAVSDAYKTYFNENKPRMSYYLDEKKKTRVFVDPKVSIKDTPSYGMSTGIEFRY